jgi:hypothetical protein
MKPGERALSIRRPRPSGAPRKAPARRTSKMSKPESRLITAAALAKAEADAVPARESWKRDDLIIIGDRPLDSFFWPDRKLSAVRAIYRDEHRLHLPLVAWQQIEWVIPRSVTDRYRDALDSLSDVIARLRAHETNLRVILSARDAGLHRYIVGGVPPELGVVVVIFSSLGPDAHINFECHFDRHFDDACEIDIAYDNSLSICPGAFWMREAVTNIELGQKIRRTLVTEVFIRIDSRARNGRVNFCDGWAFRNRRTAQPCDKCERPTVIYGPLHSLEQQREMLLPLTEHRDYVVLPPDMRPLYEGCYCVARLEPSHRVAYRWYGVQRLLIDIVLSLGALPTAYCAHLPVYVLLWIFDMLPGATLWREMSKVRTIEGTLASMRRIRAARPDKRPPPH